MNRLIILTFLILCFGQLKSQTIEIGQDADEVKQIIKWRTQQRTGYDSFGNPKGNNVVWDANYYNGQITDVIQCWTNQHLVNLRMSVNFCKYYIMENGELAYVLTQYENISLDKLKKGFENSNNDIKIDDYYFSQDYKTFSTIYLAKNGYATAKWEKTDTDLLPSSIKKSIQAKIKQKEDEEYRKELAQQKEKEKEKEIKSKIYDLELYDKYAYDNAFQNQKDAIVKYFNTSYYSSANFPSFDDLVNRENKFERFNNTYDVHYSLEDHSRESVDYGYVIQAGTRDIKPKVNVKLVSGTDTNVDLFRKASIRIPTIEIEGYEVMTKASFDSITIDFARGITEVKIKNGIVSFKKDIPENYTQIQIMEKLKSENNGRYLVKYEIGAIMGESILNVEIEKTKSNGAKVLRTVAGAVLIIGILVFLG